MYCIFNASKLKNNFNSEIAYFHRYTEGLNHEYDTDHKISNKFKKKTIITVIVFTKMVFTSLYAFDLHDALSRAIFNI